MICQARYMNETPKSLNHHTIKGHLDSERSDWYDGLTVTVVNNGETILTGALADQPALDGVLISVPYVRLPLLSPTRTGAGRQNAFRFLIHPAEEGCRR